LLDQFYFIIEQRLRLDAQISRLELQKEKNSNAAGAAAASNKLASDYDSYMKSINSIPDGAQTSPLNLAILRDQIIDLDITHILYLKIQTTGGEARKVKSLWSRGGETSYLGGVSLNYVLAEKNGRIVVADNINAVVEIFHTIGSREPFDIKERILSN
jgi:hypothetical protein